MVKKTKVQVDVYQKYLDLDQQIKALEAAKEEMRAELLKEVQVRGDICKHGFNFKQQVKKSWKYTPEIAGMKDILKRKKELEQAEGKAKLTEKAYLMVTRAQED